MKIGNGGRGQTLNPSLLIMGFLFSRMTVTSSPIPRSLVLFLAEDVLPLIATGEGKEWMSPTESFRVKSGLPVLFLTGGGMVLTTRQHRKPGFPEVSKFFFNKGILSVH